MVAIGLDLTRPEVGVAKLELQLQASAKDKQQRVLFGNKKKRDCEVSRLSLRNTWKSIAALEHRGLVEPSDLCLRSSAS